MNNIINNKINEVIKETEPKRKIFKNVFIAFIVGGLICLFGEIIFKLFYKKFSEDLSNNYMLIVLISISSLLTCFGLYDKIGQFAGCGTIIPITGFANSMTSAAIEGHSEGLVLGVVNNVFKLAGSVIVSAIVTGVFTGLIYYIGGVIFA